MLPEQRLAAAFWQEETRAHHAVEEQHGQGGGQHRQREQQQNRGDEQRPNGQRHAEIGHAGRAHVDDRRDVVDRAHQRRNTDEHQGDDPQMLTPFDAGVLRFRGERRVAGPAAGRRTAGHEETRQHDHAGDRADPERQHVQFGESHVAGADHQRNEKIAEGADHDRHDDEEDHDRRVHGEQRVIGLRRDDAAAVGTGVDVGFWNKVEPRNRRFRPGQLPAHQHGEQCRRP